VTRTEKKGAGAMLAGKSTVVITGATGFLGSHIMASMLEKGRRVIVLGRPSQKEPLRDRVEKLLRWFGITWPTGRLYTVESDFLKPRCGLPPERYAELCAATDQIIHCASDTSFFERGRARVFESNVGCLKELLEFASASGVSFFHYVSTAYAAGLVTGLCPEKLPAASGFTNVYEESKALAEKVVTGYCSENSIPLNILRPSIVYGDSVTGRALKFNALYLPVKSLAHIRDIYLNDIINHGGKKSRECGIRLGAAGRLLLPLRIYLPKSGSVNLVPVDYFVRTALSIIEKTSHGGIYHITTDAPSPPETLVAFAERFLNICGVEIVCGNSYNKIMRNPPEELFNRFIEPYRPYMSDGRSFERKNTDAATGGASVPACSYETFGRCMEFAVAADWGGRVLDTGQ